MCIRDSSIDTGLDETQNAGLFWEIRSIFRVTDSGLDDMTMRTCFIDRVTSVEDIYVLDPEEFSGNQVEDFELVTVPITSEFSEGYFFQVKQFSLSETAFMYWNGIDILSEREGSVFDRPVGQVPSNLVNVDDPSNEVFGFFFATEEELIRKRVPDELFSDVSSVCPMAGPCTNGPGGACTCGVCCDCRQVENSSMVRPSFFID